MTVSQNVRASAREEHGAVLVLVTLWLPVLILFAMFVIDVGNWFEHKRHLQMQADAAALAGAGRFASPCTTDTAITTTTRDYVGPHDGWTTSSTLITDNSQVGGTPATKVHFELNSPTWYRTGGDSSPTDSTVVTGTPCTARMVDVKLTETDLPWYFDVPGLLLSGKVNYIDAHARVEIKALQRLSGALPVGVPDVRPKKGLVRFINEDTGAVIASTALTSKGPSGSLTVWDNSEAPLAVPINAPRIGVRVTFSGSNSTTCGDPLVECYDLGSANGLLFMRGYPTGGRGANDNPPVAQDVQLSPGTCGDPYFSGGTGTCTVGIDAHVDIGTIDPANYQVTAFGGRCPNAGCPLAYSGGSSWQASIDTDPQVGGVPIELKWQQIGGAITGYGTCSATFKKTNPCQGTFGVVQRTYRAFEDYSGPIELAQIWQGASFWVGSAPSGSTPNLVVKIGIAGALQPATSVTTPIVALKLAGGSRTQAVDCDPDWNNLREELANGCKPLYEINDGATACPATRTDLWAGWPSQPTSWKCVAIETGAKVGQVSQGMSDRINGVGVNTCTHPNYWSDFPVFSGDDPRIVPVFLTPYGSFSGSGSGVVPVINFGTFYVTGWFGSPCTGDDPVPGQGYIVGRFIQHIYTINNGGGGDDFCTFDQFGSCIAILTE